MGKGTLVDRLLEREPGLWLSRSWTTRRRRPGEAPDAYTFVSRPEFEARVRDEGFLEWAELDANHELYGTPWPEAPEGCDVVLEIDVQGAGQVLERDPDAVVVLVVAPSPEEQAARMRGRGDDEDHIASRVALGRQEEAEGRRIASHVVVNDDVDRAAEELAGILRSHRSRRPPAS